MTIQDCIIFIDFEGSKATGVVEYGWVAVEKGELIDFGTGFCQPNKEMNRKEMELHGLNNSDLAFYEEFSSKWELFAQLRERNTFAAHNASVENNFLRWTWPHPRVSQNRLEENLCQTWGPWIDTLMIVKLYYPHLESYKLEDLIAIFQLNNTLEELVTNHCPSGRQKFHCALYDAFASVAIYKHIREAVYQAEETVRKLLIDSAPKKNQQNHKQSFLDFG